MRRCEHCGVDVRGGARRCPLCQSVLAEKPEDGENIFPREQASGTVLSRRFFAWLGFGTVCSGVVCVAINMILPANGWWSLFVLAGLASLWADLGMIVKKRKNTPKNILWQVALISVIALIWDHFTGAHGWSLDYVLPLLCICAMVSMWVLAKIRRLQIQDYILYLIMVCILGLVSFILVITGTVNVVIPSAICFASSIIFLTALIIFEGKALWAEIQRRLHL